MPLTQLYYHLKSFITAVIFCDFKVAILAVNSSSTPASSDILECKNLFRRLYDLLKQVVLQWIPRHGGITGNELADYLAKQVDSILQTSRNAILFNNIKLLISH